MIELRDFTGKDLLSFQGANNLPNEGRPMIAEGENAILILAGFDPDGFGIEIIPAEGNRFSGAFKAYDDIEKAKSDAKIFAQLLDCNLTEEFLQDFGFIIY